METKDLGKAEFWSNGQTTSFVSAVGRQGHAALAKQLSRILSDLNPFERLVETFPAATHHLMAS